MIWVYLPIGTEWSSMESTETFARRNKFPWTGVWDFHDLLLNGYANNGGSTTVWLGREYSQLVILFDTEEVIAVVQTPLVKLSFVWSIQ